MTKQEMINKLKAVKTTEPSGITTIKIDYVFDVIDALDSCVVLDKAEARTCKYAIDHLLGWHNTPYNEPLCLSARDTIDAQLKDMEKE